MTAQSSVFLEEQGPWEARPLPLGSIIANPAQPRRLFDQDEIDALASSIASVGLLQPLLVRPAGDGYELVAGERRLRACTQLGWSAVPAVIRNLLDDEVLPAALIENLQRVDLNALEEAAAYRTLMDDLGLTQEDVADRVGKSRSYVAHYVGLLRLPPRVQHRIAAGVLSVAHAKLLMGLRDPAVAERLSEAIVAEGLTVAMAQERILLGNLRGAEGPAPGDADYASTRRRRPRTPTAGRAAEIESEWASRLDTSVRITMGRRGRLIIDFADLDDLERISGIVLRGTDRDVSASSA